MHLSSFQRIRRFSFFRAKFFNDTFCVVNVVDGAAIVIVVVVVVEVDVEVDVSVIGMRRLLKRRKSVIN